MKQAMEDQEGKVKVKPTPTQSREVRAVGVPASAYLVDTLLVFHGDYEENAKALVLALEQRIERLNAEREALIHDNRNLIFPV